MSKERAVIQDPHVSGPSSSRHELNHRPIGRGQGLDELRHNHLPHSRRGAFPGPSTEGNPLMQNYFSHIYSSNKEMSEKEVSVEHILVDNGRTIIKLHLFR